MTYSVKEIFYTLQGEGINAGRPAVFCRFSGCNLWSGREADRTTAICTFCDTDFVGTDGVGGGKFQTADSLASAIEQHWTASDRRRRFVVLTGGEPMLQIDEALISALHERDFFIAVETNGTIDPVADIDWICVSPKAGTTLSIRSGHELKLVYPQKGAEPDLFEKFDFQHFLLQPMDGAMQIQNTELAVAYCKKNPLWNLSVQTHKMIGIR